MIIGSCGEVMSIYIYNDIIHDNTTGYGYNRSKDPIRAGVDYPLVDMNGTAGSSVARAEEFKRPITYYYFLITVTMFCN